jgi:hypothetical protein
VTHEFIPQIEAANEVILNNVVIPIEGTIGYELVNSYGKQMAQGDPGPNDHPLNSVITQATWTGGIGTKKYKGDDSRGNSWWTTLWDGTENQLTLGPRSVEFPAAEYAPDQEAAAAYVHDKLDGFMYFTYGQKIRRWSELLKEPIVVGSDPLAPATITGKGVTFGDEVIAKKIYIPCSSSYITFDGGAFTAGIGGEGAISFVVWQQKLFKVDAQGVVKVFVTGVTPSWSVKGRLTNDVTPHRLFLHYDNDGQTAVHVATSGGVYIVDYVDGLLFETPTIYPDHPDFGKAASLWRADAFIAVGAGVLRDAKGLVTAVGPDGRDGLPEVYAFGHFVDFAPGYNGLLGLYRAYDPNFVPSVEKMDMGVSPPEAMYSQEIDSYGILFEYNTLGWHPRWVHAGIPLSVGIASHTSGGSGVYRAFWSTTGTIWSQILPIGYYNPLYNQNTFPKPQTPLERFGQHITPWFNFGVDDNSKIVKQLEFKTNNCDEKNSIVVYVQFEDEDRPTFPFASITTNGEHHLDIGFSKMPLPSPENPSGGIDYHEGTAFERMRIMIEMYGDPDDDYSTPLVEWYTLVGRKWMRANLVFSFTANLTQPHNDVSTYDMFRAIQDAATKKGASTLVINNQRFDVDVTQANGNIAPDLQFSSYMTVSAAETTEIDN